jgi:hypothetical protein
MLGPAVLQSFPAANKSGSSKPIGRVDTISNGSGLISITVDLMMIIKTSHILAGIRLPTRSEGGEADDVRNRSMDKRFAWQAEGWQHVKRRNEDGDIK